MLLLQFVFLCAISLFGNIETNDRCANKLCRGPRFTQSNCCANYICEYSYFPATPELKICQSNENRLKIFSLQDIIAATENKPTTTPPPKEADYLDSPYGVSKSSEPDSVKTAEFNPFDKSDRLKRIKELKKKKQEDMKKKAKKAGFDPFDNKERLKRLKELKKRKRLNKSKENDKVMKEEKKPTTHSNKSTSVKNRNYIESRSNSGSQNYRYIFPNL